MQVRAFVFDLWGTLVPSPVSRRDDAVRAMAADLGVDASAYAAAFRDSHAERFTGVGGSLEDTIAALAARCGGTPSAVAVARAARRRLELTRSLLAAGDESLAVLDELRARGFRLGLVTDSSIETPTLWYQTPLAARFDAVAFSCLLGVRKPDPAIFLACLERLGAPPGDCVYVGDGGGGELSAAQTLDMHAVRLVAAHDDPSSRYDDDVAFVGPRVAGLRDLLALPWASGPSRSD
jgi:putative hydrolase of the HAD superfamily